LGPIIKHMDVLIAGCGFTGSRVASRMLSAGDRVWITTRHPASVATLEQQGARLIEWDATCPQPLPIPDGAAILHSIPSLAISSNFVDPTPALLGAIQGTPSRMVYLSTTGVYGSAREVDHHTHPDPRTAREHVRLDAERNAAGGPWSTLILRPAAIYGPGRGIHVSMLRGEYKFVGTGENYVSRIHVDDLAAHAEGALRSDVVGAYPVADEHPCSAREIAEFCSKLLNIPMPTSVAVEEVHDTRRADRRVDGSEIRRLLGLSLLYPSYRTGIPVSLHLASSQA